MSIDPADQQYLLSYGPDANCTLAICPADSSIQGYRPSLGANATFLALIALSMLWHLGQGFRYKIWDFTAVMITGCIGEIIGYAGRIILYQNPFSFPGFVIDIVCITISPVFFAAAIYVSLTRITEALDPKLCRFNPKLYYWVFVPCDIVSLVLQAVGGAVSSSTTDGNDWAVNITIAGLAFQVFTLVVFIGVAADYVARYWKQHNALPLDQRRPITPRLKVFSFFFSLSILCILIRCCYRIAELAGGYTGPIFHNQGLFIGLESVMIVIAVLCLNVGHIGFAFKGFGRATDDDFLPADKEANPSDSDGAV